ncbi:unnamed protein product [Cylicocyclus nassatus]|uniref:Dihydroorotate dehydrogenase (quinone), mitochondrial n=1 Tax=Cylicocyclus nassatus TaxID=53992 RepID=A0AA36GMX2_CYLNA|nr:unnamed protein product [Cylicocyclus nassatus]
MFSRTSPPFISRSAIYIVGGGLLGYGATELLFSSETFQSKALLPVINRYMDVESSQNLALRFASWGFLPKYGSNRKEYPELKCEFLGKSLKNPVGLAAGFDKNGKAIRPLAELSGFGLIEIGSVTPIPNKGNPRPRLFRLEEDEGLINRYGSNSDGVGKVHLRVRSARTEWMENAAILGISLANNMLTDDSMLDYEIGVNYFAPYSDYIVINISPTNARNPTFVGKNGELKKLMQYAKHLLDCSQLESRPRILLKIPPDLSEIEKKNVASLSLDPKNGVDGLIVSDTTSTRPDNLKSENRLEIGGLSGAPLRRISTECVREMYRLTNGQVPIIGCGGISSGADAYEKIKAGASVVQLYSALVFHGFPVVGKVKRELVELLKQDGYTNVSQAVGADHRAR